MVSDTRATDGNDVPWGTYLVDDRWLRFLRGVARSGLGRGKLKHLFRSLWTTHSRRTMGTVVDEQRFGFKWRLNYSDNDTDLRLLFAPKPHDRVEIAALSDACDSGVFVDVGANVGYHTLHLAKHGARVLALEPNPLAFQRLRYHVQLNHFSERVTALPVGVGEEGEVPFYFDGLESGSTVVHEPTAKQAMVRLSPLAKILLSEAVRQVDAIKVDVEGAEDQVLVPFLRDWPKEDWPRCIVMEDKHRDLWQVDVVEYMQSAGYGIRDRTRLNVIMWRT